MTELKVKSDKKRDTLAQVKAEVEQLSDVAMKERMRPLVPAAIEKIKKALKKTSLKDLKVRVRLEAS